MAHPFEAKLIAAAIFAIVSTVLVVAAIVARLYPMTFLLGSTALIIWAAIRMSAEWIEYQISEDDAHGTDW